jgi:hypothetical protein
MGVIMPAFKLKNGELIEVPEEVPTQEAIEQSLNSSKTILEANARAYQKAQIDENTKAEMDKSEALLESGVATFENLPKAAQNGYWLEVQLWGTTTDEASPKGTYQARKKALIAGQEISFDFANIGPCPFGFHDIREERKTFLVSK